MSIEMSENPSKENSFPNFFSSDRKRHMAMARWATENYTKVKKDRNKQELQWYTNIAFYMGKQNIEPVSTSTSSTGWRLTIPETVPWRVRLVTNKIRPLIRTEISKIMSNKPIIEVLPGTSEDEDILSAEVGKQIFWDAYRRKKIKQVFQRAQFWNSTCGNGFIKSYWDSNATDSYGQKGDFCIEPITPFHIFVPDLREKEIEDQPWVIHGSTKSPEWVKKFYKKDVVANTKAASDLLDDSFLRLIGTNSVALDSVLCLEVWVKPGILKEFPDGGVYVVAGDVVVMESKGHPYEHSQYPFSKLDHIDTGKFYSDSVIVDLIPLQREYNRTNSQIIEAKNLMAKPKLMAPKGSINANSITSEPGQVILYNPSMGKPEPLPMAPLPNYVFDSLARIQQDMDDISGQHEVTRGGAPSGVTAASAISYLQEQDDSKLAHTIDSVEAAMEKVGRQILFYAHQFWSEERTVRTVGVDGSFSAKKFKTSDLKQTNELVVEAGSAMPYSKAARQALIMDMMKMGFIQPDQGLGILEIGGMERLFDELQKDKRQTQRENIRMTDGEQLSVNDWDNHEVHKLIHDSYRKSQSYEQLPENIKIIFQAHTQMHKDMIQQMQMEQLQMQMQADPNAAPQDAASYGQQKSDPAAEQQSQIQQALGG